MESTSYGVQAMEYELWYESLGFGHKSFHLKKMGTHLLFQNI
jgi:hypothetical protein